MGTGTSEQILKKMHLVDLRELWSDSAIGNGEVRRDS